MPWRGFIVPCVAAVAALWCSNLPYFPSHSGPSRIQWVSVCVISCNCSVTEMFHSRDCFWDSLFLGLSWLTKTLVNGHILFGYVKTIIQAWDPTRLFSVTLYISDLKHRQQFHTVIRRPSDFLSFNTLGIARTTFTNYSANMHLIPAPDVQTEITKSERGGGSRSMARAQSCQHGVSEKYWLIEA